MVGRETTVAVGDKVGVGGIGEFVGGGAEVGLIAGADAQADSNRLIVDKMMTKLAVVFFILSPCHDLWNLFLS